MNCVQRENVMAFTHPIFSGSRRRKSHLHTLPSWGFHLCLEANCCINDNQPSSPQIHWRKKHTYLGFRWRNRKPQTHWLFCNTLWWSWLSSGSAVMLGTGLQLAKPTGSGLWVGHTSGLLSQFFSFSRAFFGHMKVSTFMLPSFFIRQNHFPGLSSVISKGCCKTACQAQFREELFSLKFSIWCAW